MIDTISIFCLVAGMATLLGAVGFMYLDPNGKESRDFKFLSILSMICFGLSAITFPFIELGNLVISLGLFLIIFLITRLLKS